MDFLKLLKIWYKPVRRDGKVYWQYYVNIPSIIMRTMWAGVTHVQLYIEGDRLVLAPIRLRIEVVTERPGGGGGGEAEDAQGAGENVR